MTTTEYRRLLGAVLVWAVVPLPFLYIILPPFWLIAGSVGLMLLVRPAMQIRLSLGVLNGLGILIIIIVVAVGGLRVGPLRPLGHLLLLLLSVRAIAVEDRKTFKSALLPVFLVWVVAVASSTHIAIAPYFACSAAVWWWVGMRVHMAGTGLDSMHKGQMLPRPRHVVAAAAAALMVAAPIFVVMPRLRAPWIAGRGGVSSVTGFSSHVGLGGVGTIRQSPEIAMVVRSLSGEVLEHRWMRLRAAALERVTLDSWAPRGALLIPDGDGRMIWPYGRRWSLEGAVELEVVLEHPRRYLFLPEGTVAVSSPVPLRLDPSGGVVLASRVRGPFAYKVWVTRGPPPQPTDPPPDSLPSFDLHPNVQRLALDMVAGHETELAKARAVESYLQQNYTYSLSGMTHMRSDPVAWFLLAERRGHCEYFAGAMVAVLNGLGIPARLVAGYSGGSLSGDGESAVVREANAHTWVEALVGPGPGWTTFDPTPVTDVPPLSRATGRERFLWALESAQSMWDRYVLTFGFGEQIQVLSAGVSAVEAVLRSVSLWKIGLGLMVLSAVGLGWRRFRNSRVAARPRRGIRTPAAAVFEKLAGRLAREGIAVPPAATVRWIANRARDQWRGSGAQLGDLAWLAERELYAERVPRPADRATVRTLWAQVRRGMKRKP